MTKIHGSLKKWDSQLSISSKILITKEFSTKHTKHCIIPCPTTTTKYPWLKSTTNHKATFTQEIETNILEEEKVEQRERNNVKWETF